MLDSEFLLNTGIPIILNIFGFVTSLLAALFWYRSAKVEIPYNDEKLDKHGMHAAGVIIEKEDGRKIDPFASASRANELNAIAASFAAAAVAAQAFVYFFPEREKISAEATKLWHFVEAIVPFN